jgi:ATP-binding cassette subfamily F protein uup
MNYLSVEEISRSYGPLTVFERISFGIDKGEKVGLIARNGTGKSSMLDCLIGLEPPDEGIITFRNGITLGYLAQKQVFDPDKTILETVFAGDSEEMSAIRAYELEMDRGKEDERFFEALSEMERTQAWGFEAKAKEILFKLGLQNMDKEVGKLSGGQQKRLGLALELIKEPDFLILDEPTNHLDIEMTEWLEDQLSATSSTLLMVTHDRFFLDNVCDVILELERGELYRHKGNYSYFVEKKAEREENLATVVDKAKSAMKKELEWIRRQPKARGTKAKYRVNAFDTLKKIATQDLSQDEIRIEINVPRMGSKVIELHKVHKGYDGKKLIEGFSYIFLRNDRIGIIGANGTGKSTLLNMITGSVMPDQGKVVIGDTVKFGYFTQKGLIFKEGQRVIDSIREIADVIPLTKGQKISAAQLLERFMFPRDMHFNVISSLSGGEQRRLHLLKVLMGNPNVLILDEPTNDLDIFTLQILEEYLLDYPGVVIIVSHDRHFMDKIVEHSFVFEGKGGIRNYPGNYSQYRAKKDLEDSESKAKQKREKNNNSEVESSAPSSNSSDKVKLTYAERLEYDTLEGEIEALEDKIRELSEQITESNDNEELLTMTTAISNTQLELDRKTDRWMHLAQFVL